MNFKPTRQLNFNNVHTIQYINSNENKYLTTPFFFNGSIGSAQTNIKHIVQSATRFNGCTNYWHDDYENAYRYGSSFELARLDVERTIAQSKMDVAEDLHLNGLDMEEGFMDYLLQHDFQIESHLSIADIRFHGKPLKRLSLSLGWLHRFHGRATTMALPIAPVY